MACAEICIVGGGPAGLATAIAFRKEGLQVDVFDCAQAPVDKACGEGIMPDGIAALAELGIAIPAGVGFPFRGIRFIDGGCSFAADFPSHPACGLRRLVIHDLLATRAAQTGVALHWGMKRVDFLETGLRIDGELIQPKLLVAADGLNSPLRRASGLHEPLREEIRYGFRRHYAIAPWSPYVELHWGKRSQIYITPISDWQIGVAILSRDSKLRLDDGLAEFPEVRSRLAGVPHCSAERGSLTISRRLKQVSRPGFALLGDASGSVDAITGEGLSLAFRQAIALANAFESGDLRRYERAHRRLLRRPQKMATVLLALERRPRLRAQAFSRLAKHPDIFARLLAFHTGEPPSMRLSTTSQMFYI
jgi:2-polyprenyl-6-methoxyphenol hydroxylase-like FAD-dependent oxidoreductase